MTTPAPRGPEHDARASAAPPERAEYDGDVEDLARSVGEAGGDDPATPRSEYEDAAGPVTVARPARPPVEPGRTPPRLRPPDPPWALRASARTWRLTAVALGLAVGLSFFDLPARKARLHALVVERADGLPPDDVNLATNIVLFGGVLTWGLLAVLALVVGARMRRPSLAPRMLGLLLLLVLLVVLGVTAMALTSGDGLALAARVLLGIAGATGTAATLLGLFPGTLRWVRTHRAGGATHPATGLQTEPTPPTRGR
ncbi:hypothetical protein [Ornithinimicrobium cerasi]|uniref:hypothetical protein n=1 Tax=Ornithinimicrobium cerasi TaxID=2248773 RepID=UPI00137983B6|nr:hypothetical protein [Ornithinimicrobium cerasi]